MRNRQASWLWENTYTCISHTLFNHSGLLTHLPTRTHKHARKRTRTDNRPRKTNAAVRDRWAELRDDEQADFHALHAVAAARKVPTAVPAEKVRGSYVCVRECAYGLCVCGVCAYACRCTRIAVCCVSCCDCCMLCVVLCKRCVARITHDGGSY